MTAKEAAVASEVFLREQLSPSLPRGVRLEEVNLEQPEIVLITLSYFDPERSGISVPGINLGGRLYKTFKVATESQKVVSMSVWNQKGE